MNPHAQGTPQSVPQELADYYVWEVPGKPVAVYIRWSVIDRLSAELMRGYGANPKRSAEVGGVLIGSVEEGSPTVVRVEDFEVVPCQYRRGPSYIFTQEDCEPFEQAGIRADGVGYFRSHTRDGLSLGAEDIELLDHFFAGAATVALLVKPYATKVSVAGIFVRENGTFPATTPLEFPFRRLELTGQEPSARREMSERRPRRHEVERPPERSPASYGHPPQDVRFPEPAAYEFLPERNRAEKNPELAPAYATRTERSRMRNGWVWIPLSFVFLLLGVALGFQAALSVGNRASNAAAADFSLSLSVTKVDQNLSVHWNRLAPAVRASQRGVLEIEEQGAVKPVDLDAAQLQNGTLIYRNATSDVRFRLTVFPKESVSVTESAEWRQ
jgi:hypothetical protein